MTTLNILITLSAIHFVAAASPGPNFVIVGNYAATHSRKYGLLAALGIILGTASWILLAILGVGAMMAAHPFVHTAIKYAGALYLVWLGIKMIVAGLRNKYHTHKQSQAVTKSARSVILAGFIANMTNPKSIVYYTSLFAVLLPPAASIKLYALAGSTALFISIIWWLLVAVIFSTGFVSTILERIRRYIDLFFGGVQRWTPSLRQVPYRL